MPKLLAEAEASILMTTKHNNVIPNTFKKRIDSPFQNSASLTDAKNILGGVCADVYVPDHRIL